MTHHAALPPEQRDQFLPRLAVLAIVVALTWLAIFCVRLAGPFELTDSDQQRPAAYTLDVLVNGQWIVQRDDTGDIASKPPLYTWIMALGVKALGGRLTEFTLYLPGALSVLGISLLVLFSTSRYFGRGAGLIAALAYLLAWTTFKQVYLARTDALFALTVFATMLLAWHASTRQGSWIWFWLMAAAATLTKGPLGLLLALGGCLAFLWRKDRPALAEPTGTARHPLATHAAGFALFMIICGGWFLLAWLKAGQPFIDKVIGDELVGHAVESGKGQRPFQGFWKQPLYFLSRYLPWSPIVYFAILRLLIRPGAEPWQRLFHRFVAFYFLFGLAIFSIAPHQRADHLFPLIPAAAILAGVEIARWFSAAGLARVLRVYPLVLLVVLAGTAAFLRLVYADTEHAKLTRESRKAAGWIRENLGAGFPLIHTDGPFAVQFFLNTMYQRHDAGIAHERAILHPNNAYLLTRDQGRLWWLHRTTEDERGHGRELHFTGSVPRSDPALEPAYYIMGNTRTPELDEPLVTLIDNMLVEMEGVRFLSARGHSLDLEVRGPSARVRVESFAPLSRSVRVRLFDGDNVYTAERELGHGDELVATVPGGPSSE